MGTFSRSLAVTKQSWSVLKANPQLALFPLISAVVSVIVIISFAVPGFFLLQGTQVHSQDSMPPLYYAYMFCFYLVSYFVVIFFNAGLVTCAHEIFSGRPATFKDGIRNAFSHFGSILAYALIAATVGMVLRMISERSGLIGRIVTSIIGMAWTVATYFVAPILVLENKSPFAAIQESSLMLRRTWGERLVLGIGTNAIFMLLGLLAIIPLFVGIFLIASGMMIVGAATVLGAVIFLIAVSLVSSTLTGMFQTALYMYASSGQLPNVYDPTVVQYAFRSKDKRGATNYPRY